jgi:hypothetical protein
VSTATKKIADGTMNGEKTLSMPRGFEPTHLPLSLTGRLMKDFGVAVLPSSLC